MKKRKHRRKKRKMRRRELRRRARQLRRANSDRSQVFSGTMTADEWNVSSMDMEMDDIMEMPPQGMEPGDGVYDDEEADGLYGGTAGHALPYGHGDRGYEEERDMCFDQDYDLVEDGDGIDDI